VSKNTWKCAQIEMGERRKNDIDKKYSHKIFCGNCGGEYKCSYRSLSQNHSEFWRCTNYIACDDYKLRATTVDEVFIKLYNHIIAEKYKYIEKWKGKLTDRNIYYRYKTELFLEHLKVAESIETYDDYIFLLFVKRIKVLDKFKFRVVLTNNSKIIIEL
jgi:hypothetical protein